MGHDKFGGDCTSHVGSKRKNVNVFFICHTFDFVHMEML